MHLSGLELTKESIHPFYPNNFKCCKGEMEARPQASYCDMCISSRFSHTYLVSSAEDSNIAESRNRMFAWVSKHVKNTNSEIAFPLACFRPREEKRRTYILRRDIRKPYIPIAGLVGHRDVATGIIWQTGYPPSKPNPNSICVWIHTINKY